MGIDFGKREDGKKTLQGDNSLQLMEEQINSICKVLVNDNNDFEEEAVCDNIVEYIHNYHRILYAFISNFIYRYYEEHDSKEASQRIGSMISNMEKIISYTKTKDFQDKRNNSGNKKDYDDTSKAVLKIWDHISLANQQYSMLKQSDEEYEDKFNKKITPFKEELTKDMNAQLLTMVGIFTALAFLIFGGISSLDSIFSNAELPVLKIMIIGSVWGLCIINLVFVFLFCVSKMANFKLESVDDEDASIFQKYPIVWWSNFVIISIMLFCMWGYYLMGRNINNWFDKLCLSHPELATIAGGIIILGVVVRIGKILLKETKYNPKEK